MMDQDIRMEDWFWKCQSEDDKREAAKDTELKQSRKDTRWMNRVRRILLVEMAVILFEAMYRFGSVVRGYNSFGGESVLLLALIGVSAWRLRDIIK